MSDSKDSKDVWMVGDVLDAMSSGSAVPAYILRIVQEVQAWLTVAVVEESQADPADLAIGSGDRQYAADLEYLFNQFEWVGAYADLVPVARETGKHEDAAVLSIGPIVLDEGLRMMVDHVTLFASEKCRRVWLISDTWVIGDVINYLPHLKVLRARGIELRFILVTPWGYSEIPWNRGK